jgi:predicted dinucleotide-binding enzyme
MSICGNDEAAKKTVIQILTQFGWETTDMGKAEAGRATMIGFVQVGEVKRESLNWHSQ